jgi:hypothetical protein
VLVGGGGDDVVDGGGSSSLPQKPGAGKKTSRQIWKVGTQICIKEQEANPWGQKTKKTSKLADRQLTNLTCGDTLINHTSTVISPSP